MIGQFKEVYINEVVLKFKDFSIVYLKKKKKKFQRFW